MANPAFKLEYDKTGKRPNSTLAIMINTLSALAIFAVSGTAMPCYAPPPMLFRDHAVLVKEADTILFVEVMSGSDTQENFCDFRVVSTLKGSEPERIPVDCRLPNAGDWMTHFSAHSEAAFWKQRSGRLGIKNDCTLIHPAFEIGRYYLLFLGVTSDTKQFEELADPFDHWLVFVKKQVSRGKP